MGILKALLICALTVSVCGIHQKKKLRDAIIMPVSFASRDGRPECALVKSLENTVPKSCSVDLPHHLSSSFFETREVLLCFGVYDTYYQLCKHNNTLSNISEGKYEVQGFCERAKTAFVQYSKFEHDDTVIKVWVPPLKNSFSNADNCTSLCIFNNTEIDPRCSMIVRALEIYPEVKKNAGSTKSDEAHTAALSPNKNDNPAMDPITETKTSSNVEVVEPGLDSPKVSLPKAATPASNQTVRPAEQLPEQPKPVQALVDSKTPEAEAVDIEKIVEEDEQQTNQNTEEEDPLQQNGEMSDPPLPGSESKPSKDAGAKSGYDTEFGDTTVVRGRGLDEDEESNLVTYFMLMTGGALLFYVAFHNKNKLLALALEGRRGNRRGGRHSSAAYSKLHSNLEEAIAAGPTSPSATHVLY